MGFINKLKTAFGATDKLSNSEESGNIDAIISDIKEHEPFAISDQNVLYAGLNELGGYFFFQTVIVGTLKVKSKNGAKLNVVGKNFELDLNSDSLEFESDPTEVKGRWITKIDFQIDEKEAVNIQKSQLNNLSIFIKKQELQFSIYEA